MEDVIVRLGAGGRVIIPSALRKAMGIKVGDELIATVDEDGMRMTTIQQAVARAQRLVRQYVPAGTSLADELIAERRAEAAEATGATEVEGDG